MINCDAFIVEFVSQNWLTLGVVMGVLKVIAQSTKTVLDDKIITLLSNTLGLYKKPKS